MQFNNNNYGFGLGDNNQQKSSCYVQNLDSGIVTPTPPVTNLMITEDGDFMLTENGNFMETE